MKFLSAALALGLSAATASAVAVIAPATGGKVPGQSPLEYCEDASSDILTIDHVDLSPNPPKKGEDLVITAAGTLSEDVTDGSYVFLEVAWGLVKLINTKKDLCDQLKEVNRTCPLEKGELTFEHTVTLPAQIPPGQFNVKADVYSKDKKRITCLEANKIEFKSTAGSAKPVLEL